MRLVKILSNMITIYHNNRCSKSRCAIEYLKENNYDFKIINYLENPPKISEITKILKMLNIPAIDLVRKYEKIWKENFSDKKLSESKIVLILSENPILIERPIIVNNLQARIARPLQNIFDIL